MSAMAFCGDQPPTGDPRDAIFHCIKEELRHDVVMNVNQARLGRLLRHRRHAGHRRTRTERGEINQELSSSRITSEVAAIHLSHSALPCS
jgi:hypothetical protein